MEEKVTFCPITTPRNGKSFTPCMRGKCQLWDHDKRGCGLVTGVDAIRGLTLGLSDFLGALIKKA